MVRKKRKKSLVKNYLLMKNLVEGTEDICHEISSQELLQTTDVCQEFYENSKEALACDSGDYYEVLLSIVKTKSFR